MKQRSAIRFADRQPTHPGEVLREDVLPALKITIRDLAVDLGVSRQALHSILAETADISPEMALRLGKLLGNGPMFWVRMQEAVDLWKAQQKLADQLDKIPTRRAA